ncbi:MAG: hypothetical protein J0I18_07205 [Actinobacteria bacterium]|nr:hypothetical protein [Actinomycetota bacterium]
MTEDKRPPLSERLFRTCLLLLGSALLLYLLLILLAQIWGWLLLLAGLAALVAATIWLVRWRRRQW